MRARSNSVGRVPFRQGKEPEASLGVKGGLAAEGRRASSSRPTAKVSNRSALVPSSKPLLGANPRPPLVPTKDSKPKNLEAIRAQIKESKVVGPAAFEEVAELCTDAFQAEVPKQCSEAVSLFGLVITRATPGAVRSASAAGACAMVASMLRHPQEECRKAALAEACKHLDAIQLLRAVLLIVGGKDPARRWQATLNLLQVVQLLVVKPEVLERVRACGGMQLVVEAWKQGGHVSDVAQECCTLTLQMAPQQARAMANAGAADCAICSWQRCSQDSSRSLLVQSLADVALLCLPHLPERPALLPRLACDSLRSWIAAPGAAAPAVSAAVVACMLKALIRVATTDPNSGPELASLGVPELALGVIADERLGREAALRRLAAEVFVRPVGLALGFAGGASNSGLTHGSGKFQQPPWQQMRYEPLEDEAPSASAAAWASELPKELPSASAAVEAELKAKREPQPTLGAAACAAALRRRLETWRARAVVAARGQHAESLASQCDVQELQLDAFFESGSLGPVARLGPYEYEVQLLADDGPGGEAYVQWFCFRVRQMRAGQHYTFHLTNLVKPGSLFDDGCQPVLFSKRRLQESGVGWSREGDDVAYYPSCLAGGKRQHCISFDLVFPHEEDEVFLAHAVPYTHSDLLSDLGRLKSSLLAAPSAVTFFPVALTAGGLEVAAVRLGNPSPTAPRACIVARAHPGETNASWMMRGVLELLLGESPAAKRCLEHVAWLLVPMLNPDGVAAGRTRTNLSCVDLNRHHHDDRSSETRGLREVLAEEGRQPGELLAFIDIHGHSRRKGIFAIANGSEGDPLIALLAARTSLIDGPGTSRTDVRPQDAGVGRVAAAAQGYKYSLTLESSMCARHSAAGGQHLTLDDLVSCGQAVCLAIVDLVHKEPPQELQIPEPVQLAVHGEPPQEPVHLAVPSTSPRGQACGESAASDDHDEAVELTEPKADATGVPVFIEIANTGSAPAS
ncbi:unnamed protein product, partial [Polarella glacialis]